MAIEKKMTFALAGNPNSGKTTLFNSLTGANAYVGNWPGVTVEKRSGTYKNGDIEVDIVDLPGIYSLSPYTPEEIISRNFILDAHPDCVINIIDATNLERNLYMSTQILEMDVPVVLALNMMDSVKANGMEIDCAGLAKALGVPVIPVSALRETNLDELISEAIRVAKEKREGKSFWNYGDYAEKIEAAVAIYKKEDVDNPLFHAMKALEGDDEESKLHEKAFEQIKELNVDVESFEADSADRRYKYITAELTKYRTGAPVQEKSKLSKSDKIDKVLTNRWLAIPLMIVILYVVFRLTFGENLFYLAQMGVDFGEGYPGFIHWSVSGEEFYPFAGLFFNENGINSPGAILQHLWGEGADVGIQGIICTGIKSLLEIWGSPEWLVSFIYDGVLNGISAVLGFLPQILLLFLFFSILEDSGYMARIAFVLDRIFRRFGVSGRAFLPMIMGFGCAVPAMINTRTLASEKEKIKTLRVIPFFTCGAKTEFLLVIAGAVAASVLGLDASLFTLGMYLTGFVMAIVMVIVMNHTTQREKVPPFIMELPSYHLPQPKALMLHVWDRGKHYIQKAFTVIFISAVAIWFLSSFTPNWIFLPTADEALALTDTDSILAHIGMIISPLFTPLGFGNAQGGQYAWTFSVASIQGVVAKENVTATLEQLAALPSIGGSAFEDIVFAANATGGHITTASLVAFAVFNLTTIPCFASVATAKSEMPNKKLYIGTLLFWIVSSYVLGCLTYITFEWVWTLSITLPVLALAVVGLYFYNGYRNKKEAALA